MRKKAKKDKLSDIEIDPSGSEKPEVYAIKREGANWKLSRRDWLSALTMGGLAAGASALAGGCDRSDDEDLVYNADSEDDSVHGGTDQDEARTDLMKPQADVRDRNESVVQYMIRDDSGKWVSITVPVGSALPDDAVCICDAVEHGCSCVDYEPCPHHYWHPN